MITCDVTGDDAGVVAGVIATHVWWMGTGNMVKHPGDRQAPWGTVSKGVTRAQRS